MAGQSTALPKRSDDPYKAILGVSPSTPALNVDPYAQIFAAPAPDNSAAQWMGVVNNALAPYAAAAGMGALAGLPVAEYAANLVKKTVVGAGHAEKQQIAAMIRILLPRAEAKSADAADALAVAICHAQHRGARAMKLALARSV